MFNEVSRKQHEKEGLHAEWLTSLRCPVHVKRCTGALMFPPPRTLTKKKGLSNHELKTRSTDSIGTRHIGHSP